MKTFFVVSMLAALGCTRPAPAPAPAPEAGSACTLDNGKVLDASGRADGVYGVRGEAVDPEPLIPWAGLKLEQSGVDAASGKKWLELSLSDEGVKSLGKFSAAPEGRSIAMVSGGQVASHHKIRERLTGGKVKISCCDARACERLLGVFEGKKKQ